jgi:hypothetical protein
LTGVGRHDTLPATLEGPMSDPIDLRELARDEEAAEQAARRIEEPVHEEAAPSPELFPASGAKGWGNET